MRLEPYVAGEVVHLHAPRADVKYVHVWAPDGTEIRFPYRGGRVDLWLAQVGIWRYEWSTGEEGTFDVVRAVSEPVIASFGVASARSTWLYARNIDPRSRARAQRIQRSDGSELIMEIGRIYDLDDEERLRAQAVVHLEPSR